VEEPSPGVFWLVCRLDTVGGNHTVPQSQRFWSTASRVKTPQPSERLGHLGHQHRAPDVAHWPAISDGDGHILAA
jgi:hypothetical protein